ncbi:MAG: ABC transporter substrate-binding protein [Betaproteobacteria bacterium]
MDRRVAALTLGLALFAAASAGQAADPVRIGLVDETTGPQAEAGVLTLDGVRLAVDEINAAGGILGRPVALVVEDNQSTNPGTVLAYSRLVEQQVVAVIGPMRSTQVQAASPTIAKTKLPAIIGGSDPSLTRVNNPWIFRVRPNDLYSSRVMASYGLAVIGKRKWAIIHSTDSFGTNGKNALVAALKAQGVEPVLVQGYSNNQQDFTAVLLALKKSGADIIGSYMTNSPDVGIFAKQAKQLGVDADWIGSTSLATDTALKLAGDALWGSYVVTDFFPEANRESKAFAAKFKAKHGFDPDLYSAWSYAALHLLKHAMEAAGATDPESIRKALLATRGLKGIEGTYNFDANGDGLHGYTVVRNEQGRLVFIRTVEFPVDQK